MYKCVLHNQRNHMRKTALTRDSVTSSSYNAWPDGTVRGRTSYKMWTTLTFGFSQVNNEYVEKYVFVFKQQFIKECHWFKSVFRTGVLQAFHRGK